MRYEEALGSVEEFCNQASLISADKSFLSHQEVTYARSRDNSRRVD